MDSQGNETRSYDLLTWVIAQDPLVRRNARRVRVAFTLALGGILLLQALRWEVGMEALIEKRDRIVAYLEFILQEVDKEVESTFEVITPSWARGCQLSVYLHGEGRPLFDYLMENGVITDWREPNVIRLAPAPFYCSYSDMFRFGQILKKGILEKTSG